MLTTPWSIDVPTLKQWWEPARLQRDSRGTSLRLLKSPAFLNPTSLGRGGQGQGKVAAAHRGEAPSPSSHWAVISYVSGWFVGDRSVFVRWDEQRPPPASLSCYFIWTLPSRGAAAPALCLGFFSRERSRVRLLKSLQFSSNPFFQLLIESQYSSSFSPSKAQTLQGVKKRACQISSSISSNLQARIDLGQ